MLYNSLTSKSGICHVLIRYKNNNNNNNNNNNTIITIIIINNKNIGRTSGNNKTG
jgi:hypothetical protein